MPDPSIDVMDATFVVTDPRELSRRLADPELWRHWWPGLALEVVADRGRHGVRWAVAGELTGTAEIWLEPWHDGVVVHWFLRAGPTRPRRSAAASSRLRRRYVTDYKTRVHALKDELEQARPAGMSRTTAGR